MHGGRIYRGGDVFEFQVEDSAGEVDLADVADQRDVGVVYGDIQIGLVG
jgi:hypothetical protein